MVGSPFQGMDEESSVAVLEEHGTYGAGSWSWPNMIAI
jgi:hypothetical protein